MQRHRGLVEGAGDRTIGLLVVLRRQFRFRPLPQRAGRIDLARLALLRLQARSETGCCRNRRRRCARSRRLSRYFCASGFRCRTISVPRVTRAGILLAGRRDFEPAAARRRPGPDLVRPGAAAGDDDAIGDHEGRVEADAELADQAGAVLGLGQAGQKGFGAGTRDGAEIVDQLLPVHADAAVDHGKRAGLLVGHDADFGRRAVGDQIGRGDRLVAQLVAGIRGVRNQFAQENIGFRIDRVHHQVQQFGNLGLERLGNG